MDTVNAPLCLSRFRRIRSLSLVAATFTLTLALLGASAAHAELREYRVQFKPSLSPNAAGHLLHVGTEPRVYDTTFDLGSPPASGALLSFTVDLEASAYLFVAMSTYDGQGGVSNYSNELRVSPVAPPPVVPTPTPPPPSTGSGGGSVPSNGSGGGGSEIGVPGPDEIVLGLATTSSGWMGQYLASGHRNHLTFDSLANSGDLRPARCDLDGDGDQDIVLGFDDRSAGVLAVMIMENGVISETRSILSGTASYREDAGMTFPACGDLDGDGLPELAIGFGPEMHGFIQVLDDLSTDFAPIRSSRSSSAGMISIATRRFRDVPIYPAIGDIDGDGIDELVIGSGAGGNVGIVLLDDHTNDFRPHPSAERWDGQIQPMPAQPFSSSRDVSRWPAVGDVDGDGWDEIVVSFGRGSRGQIMILDDASESYPRYGRASDQTIVVGRFLHRLTDGESVVALADIDRDGRAEIVTGFAREGAGELQVFDDEVAGFAPILGLDGFVEPARAGWTIVPSPRDAR